MNKLRQAKNTSKNFIARHRIACVAVPCTAFGLVLGARLTDASLQEAYEFIEESGLMDAFIESHPVIVK